MAAKKKSAVNGNIEARLAALRTDFGALQQDMKGLYGDVSEVASERAALAMRWLRESARKRSEKSMGQRLAAELLEASEGRGAAMKKREEVHRMAEANKAFSHFRF